jgi:UDP-N-acetylglucosamine 2-epimerase
MQGAGPEGRMRPDGRSAGSQASPRLVSIIGARPEIVQAAPLSAALSASVTEILVHTGQHYDAAMSGDQLFDTRLRAPDHDLEVGSRPDGEQLAVAEERIGEVLDAERPDAVLVRGDTNSTLAGARAAASRGLPLIHVEAGLRSHRNDMPEERNRVLTDRLADLLLAPTEAARLNLEHEGVRGVVAVTGDVMYDMLLGCRDRVPPSGREPGSFVAATVHRNYNTDDPARLNAVMQVLGAADVPVVLPTHPRTRARIREASIEVPRNVELKDPVPYTTMLALERDARLVATDSGGVQREAYMWGVPCATLREETEWVETVETGWNVLVGVDRELFTAALNAPRPARRPPVFGDGHAAQTIAGHVMALLSERTPDA